MSMKPDDIPQEIWDSALKCVPNYVKRTIVETIARAIMAAVEEENEASAKMAESGHWESRAGPTREAPSYAVWVGKIGPEIAKDIRNRQSKDG